MAAVGQIHMQIYFVWPLQCFKNQNILLKNLGQILREATVRWYSDNDYLKLYNDHPISPQHALQTPEPLGPLTV